MIYIVTTHFLYNHTIRNHSSHTPTKSDLPTSSSAKIIARKTHCINLKTGIRLNWRLIHFPPPVIDYVVVHELAHLREMNHSARFWAIVAQYYPEHRSARSELKRLAATCPHW